jgi:hypothetical protein
LSHLNPAVIPADDSMQDVVPSMPMNSWSQGGPAMFGGQPFLVQALSGHLQRSQARLSHQRHLELQAEHDQRITDVYTNALYGNVGYHQGGGAGGVGGGVGGYHAYYNRPGHSMQHAVHMNESQVGPSVAQFFTALRQILQPAAAAAAAASNSNSTATHSTPVRHNRGG